LKQLLLLYSIFIFFAHHVFYRQSLHLHDFQSIRRRTGTGPQQVVEHHAPIDDVFFEMVVFQFGEFIGQFNQVQIMRRNDAQAISSGKRRNVGLAAKATFAIVRTLKNFIDEKE